MFIFLQSFINVWYSPYLLCNSKIRRIMGVAFLHTSQKMLDAKLDYCTQDQTAQSYIVCTTIYLSCLHCLTLSLSPWCFKMYHKPYSRLWCDGQWQCLHQICHVTQLENNDNIIDTFILCFELITHRIWLGTCVLCKLQNKKGTLQTIIILRILRIHIYHVPGIFARIIWHCPHWCLA